MVEKVLIFDNDIGFNGMTARTISDIVNQRCQDVETEIFVSRKGKIPVSHNDYSAIIISGSSASASDNDDWVKRLKYFTKDAGDANKPILGICFGYHLIAAAYNAEIVDAPRGKILRRFR